MYQLHFIKKLPITIEEAWAYFSVPYNLPELTPEGMKLDFYTLPENRKIHPGYLIHLKVAPLLGINTEWIIELRHVNEPFCFIDEQRFGPFRFWQHQHHFKAVPGGVEMTDILHYKIPGGILGRILHTLVIKRKIKSLFEYRYSLLDQKFG